MVDNTRLLYAVILSVFIMVGFHFLYEKPRMEQFRAEQAMQKAAALEQKKAPQPEAGVKQRDRAAILAEGRRIKIATPALHGSVNLKGGRIDDLTLARYRETVEPDSPEIVLMSPEGSAAPHRATYAAFGWVSEDPGLSLPDGNTLWHADGTALTPDKPLTLRWDNDQGLSFVRVIAVDDQAMFTVTDTVKSAAASPVSLHAYGLVLRQGEGLSDALGIAHTGPMGVLGGTLREHSYASLIDDRTVAEDSQGGWLGITDKYWLTALIPQQDQAINAQFKYSPLPGQKQEDGLFQADYRGPAISLAPGGTMTTVTHLFAGAKQVRALDAYAAALGVARFDRAIDFGWFYFLTKPILYLLEWVGGLVGNIGIAILILTVIVKLAVLPLGLKSYVSMAKMKKLQPEVQKLTERYKDDRTRHSMEMMELYKREKVSPFSGCLPILLQIPVFFALYKVLYVGIEMRHAPFFGWIKDLSAPDPTTIVNLFGLLPFTPPSALGFLHIGIWPLLMGISMYLQQKMSPQPADPIQAKVFILLPIIFTFMLGPGMAAGLIIYWTWSNVISIAQQYFIFRKLGVKLS